jgi:hypothetical protein
VAGIGSAIAVVHQGAIAGKFSRPSGLMGGHLLVAALFFRDERSLECLTEREAHVIREAAGFSFQLRRAE